MAKMWRPDLETLPREFLQKRQLELFKAQMKYVMEKSPFYKRKFNEAGIAPEDIKKIEDIRNLPFTTKRELLKSQEECPPYGDFHCIGIDKAVRVFQTSGTTGKPLKILFSKKDWFINFYEQFSYYLYGYEIEPTDIAFFPFTYGLFVAWWGIQATMEQHGVTIVPGGGQSSEDRLRHIIEWNATVVCGTPSYVVYLGELAKKLNIDLPGSAVRIVITAGEPGAQVPATKKLIEELWGAKNYDDVGSTEITNFGFECAAQQGTHVIESMFLAECINPETGEPVAEGEVGELVLSNLCCESEPLLRYRTGDLVKFNSERCACGRTFLRLDGGIIGRADDMFHFGGVNIFPSAIENFIRQVPEFSSEYQIIVPPLGSGKRLRIRIEPAKEKTEKEVMDRAVKRFVDTIKYNIKITPEVEIVEVGTLPRFEGRKARRVIREN